MLLVSLFLLCVRVSSVMLSKYEARSFRRSLVPKSTECYRDVNLILCPTKSAVFSKAGLHDNVPDRQSAKIASVRCQLATMALKIKTVTIPKSGLHSRSCHPIWDVTSSGMRCTRLADFLPHWQQFGWDAVVRPGLGLGGSPTASPSAAPPAATLLGLRCHCL